MSLRVPEVKLTAKTEYGRNKVELRPGKGLMDWVRLASTKRLASATLPFVDNEELIKHNKPDDCWILLYNNVYDVTSYLEYHPGGVDEMMRGAGTDASDLFNEYHMWVNYNSMLKSCLVGPFQGTRSKLPKVKDVPSTALIKEMRQKPEDVIKDMGISVNVENAQMNVNFSKMNLSPENVCVCAQVNNSLRILARPYDMPSTSLVFDQLKFDEKHAFEVNVINNSVQVIFNSPNILNGLNNIPSQITKDPAPNFYKYRIDKITQLNHNCYLYNLTSPNGIYCPIPMGHHVIARLSKKGNLITRPFTPIAAKCMNGYGNLRTRLEFLIKIYQDGIFTSELVKLGEGDHLELSEPTNRINVQKLSDEPNIVMLAAGSGITPMVRIIQQRHDQKRKSTLFFFNRKHIDLIDDALLNFSFNDTHLIVKNVLSDEQNVNDDELKGRVSKELLEKHLPSFQDTQFFVCGPEGFNIAAVKSLEECGANKNHIHVFC